MQASEHLSPPEQWRLLCWMVQHPRALLEDTVPMPWRYRHPRVRPALPLGPRSWLCLHIAAGVLVALALSRR